MPYTKISDKFDAEEYNSRGFGFIDPTVEIDGHVTVGRYVVIENDVKLGRGCFIGHHATIRPFTTMGERSDLRAYAWLANNVTIGKFTVVYQYANVCMGAVLGNYIYFGCKAIMTNANDVVLHRDREFTPNPGVVEDGARVMTGCHIGPGVTVGRNSVLGIHSLALQDVPPGEVWVGSPAKFLRDVEHNDVPKAWRQKWTKN